MKKLITIILALCNAIVLYPQVIHTSSSGSMDVYADNPGDDEGYHIINVPGEDFLELSIDLQVYDYGEIYVGIMDSVGSITYENYYLEGEELGGDKSEAYILIIPNNCYIEMYAYDGAYGEVSYEVRDAPQTTTFSYDASGNRTSRQSMLVNLYSSKKSLSQHTESDFEFEEELEIEEYGREFKVYPNPVSQTVYVALNDEAIDSQDKKIFLYDNVGRQILIREATSEIEQIDMSHLKSGTYILKLLYGSESKECIIIKH